MCAGVVCACDGRLCCVGCVGVCLFGLLLCMCVLVCLCLRGVSFDTCIDCLCVKAGLCVCVMYTSLFYAVCTCCGLIVLFGVVLPCYNYRGLLCWCVFVWHACCDCLSVDCCAVSGLRVCVRVYCDF